MFKLILKGELDFDSKVCYCVVWNYFFYYEVVFNVVLFSVYCMQNLIEYNDYIMLFYVNYWDFYYFKCFLFKFKVWIFVILRFF